MKREVRINLDFVISFDSKDERKPLGIPHDFPDLPNHVLSFIQAGWLALPNAPDATIERWGLKLSVPRAKSVGSKMKKRGGA